MKTLFLQHNGYLEAIRAFIGASIVTPSKIVDDHKTKMKTEQSNVDKIEKDEGVAMVGHASSGSDKDEYSVLG